MDAGPWGKMGAHGRLDQVAGADNGQLRNEALAGPLLGSLPPTSLIKSWGRGAPRRRRVHCVQGAGEVSRGDWEGPGNEKTLGLPLGKARIPRPSRSVQDAGGDVM